MKRVWCIDPHSGGKKIPPRIYDQIIAQAAAHEAKQEWYPHYKLKLRFKGQFCYLDAYEEGQAPFPIGRLRYFEDDWILGFFAYSSETYKPCVFDNGDWFGSLEDAIDICSMYLL